ncbi:hypothetical protein D030_3263B, partial [Vibrio parahaemolyticus AQ3810]
APMKH